MTKALVYAITITLYILAPASIGIMSGLLVLRVVGVLTWEWATVTAPMWGCSLLLVLLFLLACIFDDGKDEIV